MRRIACCGGPIGGGSIWRQLRDSLLVAAGRLDETMGGPSVPLTDAPFPTRRAVYGFIERQNLPAFFRTFDFANPNTHTPERPQTTSPQQALFLLNSPYAMEQSIKLAERAATDANTAMIQFNSRPAAARCVRRINRCTSSRSAARRRVEELAEALEFVGSRRAANVGGGTATAGLAVWLGRVDDASGPVQFQAAAALCRRRLAGWSAIAGSDLGWVLLNAEGGHPGDAAHLAIRRWTAPAAGKVHIEGVLSHPSEQGDGVRGRIIASRGGVEGSGPRFTARRARSRRTVPVERGDTLDFVVDGRAGIDLRLVLLGRSRCG